MNYLGEVLQSSTAVFTAQARELDGAPELGSLVKIDNADTPIFAIVSEASTGGVEANRRPGAYGLSREELALHQPQIFELLKTDFCGVIIGHLTAEVYRAYLPPRPAAIHSFVYPCSAREIELAGSSLNYLRVLSAAQLQVGDELVAASIRWFSKRWPQPQAYLLRAGRELLKILKDDYDRFLAIMDRVR